MSVGTRVLALCGVALIAREMPAQLPGAGQRVARPATPCCTITAIDAKAGVVTATETASKRTFAFKPNQPAAIASLRIGQAVFANFTNNQVSLDGRSVCCTVTTPPSVATDPGRAVRGPIRVGGAGAGGGGGGIAGSVINTTRLANLPRVTYGEPIPTSGKATTAGKLGRVARQSVSARIGGRDVTAQILHLNGRQGIDSSGLPDGPQRLLAMHVRKLPLTASQYYLVDAQAAAQWAATHSVPAEIKPKEKEEKDSDCGTVSINGIVDCAEDAGQAIEDEFERARGQAEDWWKESTEKLAKELNEAASCFSDHTLPGPSTPVKFSISPSMTMDLKDGGSKAPVSGSLKLGFPMEGDFQARTEFFYVPCLPFVFRPKRIAADGILTLGNDIAVDVTAEGSFEKRFTIPPSGGAQIPLYVIPIVIGDVPVATLDVSAYIEGEVDLRAAGKATGKFSVSNSHRSAFDFDCGGHGCTGHQKSKADPTSRSESAQIEGQVAVQPGIFAALQLSLNYNLLQGRAGVQPYLLGIANGCAGVAMQSGGASSESSTSSALTADLDWGVKLRAEALAGGSRLGDRWEHTVIPDRHIWFGDLASGGSSALVPTIVASPQAVVAQAASIKVRMPDCYPYTSRVQYRVTWSGDAVPAANVACKWEVGTGSCQFHPGKNLALSLTWPSAGAHSVSVQLVRDDHRIFAPAPQRAQFNITVQ